MSRIRIPPIDVPAIDPATGKWTVDWYDVIKGLEKLGLLDLANIASSSPTDGQFLAYKASSGTFMLEPTTAPTSGQTVRWDATNKVWVSGA